MGISVFPAPVTSSINSDSITAISAYTQYELKKTFEPAIYTITCVNTTIATIDFYSDSTTFISRHVTVSGTVTLNLGSTADRIRVTTNTGSNVVVTITKTANAIVNTFTGTLDTITTLGSSTYTGTSSSGYAYAVLVGGGGGGGGANGNNSGNAGAGGGVCGKIVQLTGSMPVTIGAGGLGVLNTNTTNPGGASTFAGMTAGGGSGARLSADGIRSAGGTATGGTFNMTGGAGGTGTLVGTSNGLANEPAYTFIINGGTTGGGGAHDNGASVVGGGVGIGTGGAGAATATTNGSNGTGYGAGGGGGGRTSPTTGGNGTQGVLYVLKF